MYVRVECCMPKAIGPTVGELKPGDVFLYDGKIYLVLGDLPEYWAEHGGAYDNCVCLTTGNVEGFAPMTEARRVNEFEVSLKR